VKPGTPREKSLSARVGGAVVLSKRAGFYRVEVAAAGARLSSRLRSTQIERRAEQSRARAAGERPDPVDPAIPPQFHERTRRGSGERDATSRNGLTRSKPGRYL
jgi:hypothetical protein